MHSFQQSFLPLYVVIFTAHGRLASLMQRRCLRFFAAIWLCHCRNFNCVETEPQKAPNAWAGETGVTPICYLTGLKLLRLFTCPKKYQKRPPRMILQSAYYFFICLCESLSSISASRTIAEPWCLKSGSPVDYKMHNCTSWVDSCSCWRPFNKESKLLRKSLAGKTSNAKCLFSVRFLYIILI